MESTLALLVSRVFADDPHDTLASYDLAVATQLLDRCTYFHSLLLRIHAPRGARLPVLCSDLGSQTARGACVAAASSGADGALKGSGIYEAVVRNKAKLAYNGVAAWLEGTGPMPAPVGACTTTSWLSFAQSTPAHTPSAIDPPSHDPLD